MAVKALFQSIMKPREISALFKLKFGGYVKKPRKEPLEVLATTLNDVDFCFATLEKVSRSFAVVIDQLAEPLREAVCIFYLVLRGLDSVEDDMTFPNEQKLPLLRTFYTVLEQRGWTLRDVGDGPDYRVLLAHFDKVIDVYARQPAPFRATISDITRRMGEGMAQFALRSSRVESTRAYNQYCHYVAGLVGIGLNQLFCSSGLEDPKLLQQSALANSMGLFLQKVNITRDYLEDVVEGRPWWPAEIWGPYADELGDLRNDPSSERSRAALNAMICDALELAPQSLQYLGLLSDPKTFVFCALPQVMAIATLEHCFDNPAVFTSVCKIAKGLSARLMLETKTMEDVRGFFVLCSKSIIEKVKRNRSPLGERARQLAQSVILQCISPPSQATFERLAAAADTLYQQSSSGVFEYSPPMRSQPSPSSPSSLVAPGTPRSARRVQHDIARTMHLQADEQFSISRTISHIFVVLLLSNLALFIANTTVFHAVSLSASQETAGWPSDCTGLRSFVNFSSNISVVMMLASAFNVFKWWRNDDSTHASEATERAWLMLILLPFFVSVAKSFQATFWLRNSQCFELDPPLWRMAMSNVCILVLGGAIPFLAFLRVWVSTPAAAAAACKPLKQA